jgi:5-methylcytosine-specific restriction endonuclease McrA
MHDPYSVTPRKKLTPKQRLQLFLEHSGRCFLCRQPIQVGQSYTIEHVLPLALGGSNEWENLAPVHNSCASEKTRKEATERAKGRRIAEKHFGSRQSKRPMPGSKASKYKRKMDGTVVRRDEDA